MSIRYAIVGLAARAGCWWRRPPRRVRRGDGPRRTWRSGARSPREFPGAVDRHGPRRARRVDDGRSSRISPGAGRGSICRSTSRRQRSSGRSGTRSPRFPAAKRARTPRWPSIGRPTAARAVARACATNPVALAIPCHRVVPAAGGVGGYRWGPRARGRCSPLRRRHASKRSRCATRYGRSPWVDRFPRSRVPAYPRHRGTLDTDVVIVGGGLTGCATAYAFAAAGIKVGADRSGPDRTRQRAARRRDGSPTIRASASSTSRRRSGCGRRGSAWQAWRRAALDFARAGPAARAQVRLRAARRAAGRDDARAGGAPRSASRRRGAAAGLDASLVNARAIGAEAGAGAPRPLRTATARRSIRIGPRSVSPRRPRIAARGCSSVAGEADHVRAQVGWMSRQPAARFGPAGWSSPPARRRRSSSRLRGISGSGPRSSR